MKFFVVLKTNNKYQIFEITISNHVQLGNWGDGSHFYLTDLCVLLPHSWSSFETLSLFVFFPSDSLPVPPEGRDHPVPAQALEFSSHLCRWSGKRTLIGGQNEQRVLDICFASSTPSYFACLLKTFGHSLICFFLSFFLSFFSFLFFSFLFFFW